LGESQQPKTLADRLEDETVEKLYLELSEQETKKPFDFYCLAVLSELVNPAPNETELNDTAPKHDSLRFLQWLLDGLKTHPDDIALFRLVYSFLDDRIDEQHLVDVLLNVSNVVPSDRFYYLTERLWERLLQATDFESFVESLERCENNLRDHRIDAKITFYVRIFRPALFKAPHTWIESINEFIEQNSSHLTDASEYELECTQRIQEYLQIREQFINGNSVRDLIDRTIRDFATLSMEASDQSVVACQNYLATHCYEVLDAFPVGERSINTQAMPAWFWITEEVRQRLDLYSAPPRLEPERVVKVVQRMMKEFDDTENRTAWELIGWVQNTMHLVIGTLMFAWPFPLMSLFLNGSEYYSISTLMGCASVLVYAGSLQKITTGKLIQRMKQTRIEKSYSKGGRAELARFFDATHYPYRLIVDVLEHILEGPQLWGHSITMCLYMPQDTGIWIYSNSLSYLK
jgi:hypothetical protein